MTGEQSSSVRLDAVTPREASGGSSKGAQLLTGCRIKYMGAGATPPRAAKIREIDAGRSDRARIGGFPLCTFEGDQRTLETTDPRGSAGIARRSLRAPASYPSQQGPIVVIRVGTEERALRCSLLNDAGKTHPPHGCELDMMNRRTCIVNASGCSMLLTCPAAGMIRSSASGMAARNCSATSIGLR